MSRLRGRIKRPFDRVQKIARRHHISELTMPKSIHTAPQNDAARAKRAPPQVKLRLDDVDLLILSALQEDAHLSNADIGRHVGMVPSGVFERIRKLEKAKVITGYEARLDANALNFPLAAFVFVKADVSIRQKGTGTVFIRPTPFCRMDTIEEYTIWTAYGGNASLR